MLSQLREQQEQIEQGKCRASIDRARMKKSEAKQNVVCKTCDYGGLAISNQHYRFRLVLAIYLQARSTWGTL
jgi:hypothetical protein